MIEKTKLTEGSEEFKKAKDVWLNKSREVTLDTLPEFLKDLTENYHHDYGTICYAIALAAAAAARAVDKSPCGGITGFQAGAVMWEFIREWNMPGNKTGMKLVDYDNLLYPQYSYKFDNIISSDVWSNVQKNAAEHIFEADKAHEEYLIEKAQYKVDLAEFINKYPDYEASPERYDRIGSGTFDEHAEEKVKEESGFEFAPRKPYEPVHCGSAVYLHWESIIEGVIPFGLNIGED